ncbi:GspS/AspS pilotin family protein [Vibrio sp. Of14-4]|uniref:GspS/AspS pilotin family protein n=1 Tax=Vibrio sp. Of14-4 TaxID=2724878 RepID=UPI001EF171F2|nr:GspS/AspS pilotin family protein [Vibrio sp. Of14-4]MCG7488144.1 GspS/AspS pilotin family protein [Vibrio sp. Of14-4]
MKFNIILGILAASIVAGCSSSGEQRQLEMLAHSRASVIAAELPMEVGPLSILRANSKGTMIEIMMVYNQDAPKAKPIQHVLKTSIQSYCSDEETKDNLDVGLTYRIKMRNTRGQLMVDQIVSKQTCQAK